MRIYLATSWRNTDQGRALGLLREVGHDVYDFKNPAPGSQGFSWSEIDPNWRKWTADEYRRGLQHPIAERGYGHDIRALRACEACVLLLPSGRSASFELGYAMGNGAKGYVVQIDGGIEPELMYRDAEILTSFEELREVFRPRDDGMLDGGRPAETPVRALVDDCPTCPFHGLVKKTEPGRTDNWDGVCNLEARKLDDDAACGRRPPPEWCPLRGEAIRVRLRGAP
jgi:hypothetical protein